MQISLNAFRDGCVKGVWLTLPPVILHYLFPNHLHAAFIVGISLSGIIGWRLTPERHRTKALLLIIVIVCAASIISLHFT